MELAKAAGVTVEYVMMVLKMDHPYVNLEIPSVNVELYCILEGYTMHPKIIRD